MPNDGSARALVRAGRYVIGEAFASGGMGTVHLGRVVGAGGFSRVVAVKKLSPGFASDRTFREMLFDEARFASRIRHPNVVPTLDVVESGRDLYIVMEYIHGISLSELLHGSLGEHGAPERPVPTEIAAALVEAVLLGLHAAHEARTEDGTPLGVVHRDVSPHNILVGADGVARLIDFGIAHAATRSQVTAPGVLKGKTGYMAPEQLLFEPITRQTDLFGTSVVLWELLANRRLFAGRDPSERIAAFRSGEVIPKPSDFRAGVSASLDSVVLAGLCYAPSGRFRTALAMATALRASVSPASPAEIAKWLGDQAGTALEMAEERVRLLEQLPVSSAEDAAPGVARATLSESSISASLPEPPRRRRMALAGALSTVVIAGLFLGGLVLRAAPTTKGGATAPPVADIGPLPTALPVVPSQVNVPVVPPGERSAEPEKVVTAPATPSAAPKSKGPHTPPHAKPRCDPPFTVDAKGFKHYDPACF